MFTALLVGTACGVIAAAVILWAVIELEIQPHLEF
jgi:uncharacterized membrane protein YccC